MFDISLLNCNLTVILLILIIPLILMRLLMFGIVQEPKKMSFFGPSAIFAVDPRVGTGKV